MEKNKEKEINKRKTNISIAVLCLVFSLILAWQMRSVYNNEKANTNNNQSLREVQEQLLNEQHNNENLNNRLQELLQENEKIKNEKTIDEQIKKELERANMLAGLTKVSGEGITVTLSETFDMPILDTHILDVVNELRAGGAEALAINGERVVVTTEIREAAGKFVINGVRKTAPITIDAIGNKDSLYQTMIMLGGIQENLVSEGLVVDVKKKDKLSLPAALDNGTVFKTDYMKEDK